MASQSLDEVREIARNLHPYQLDRLGLTKALASVVRSAASSSEINFTSQLDTVNNLFSKEAEINLYRIVQESINNILRHSRATEASLIVERGAHDVRIEIKDNGAGFNTEPVNGEDLERRGFGLAGINERARILGAKHTIRSGPGRGTTVILKIDLPNEQ
jgi:signal transduction histidine kinase